MHIGRVSWLRLVLPTWSCRFRVPPVSELFSLSPCLTSMPWSSLSSTPSNEEVFHRILRRGCKAVGPGGPGSISLKLYQALISHYYSGKSERVNKKRKKKLWNESETKKSVGPNLYFCIDSTASEHYCIIWLE